MKSTKNIALLALMATLTVCQSVNGLPKKCRPKSNSTPGSNVPATYGGAAVNSTVQSNTAPSSQSKGIEEPPTVFWLKPLNSFGPCAHIINDKIQTEDTNPSSFCAMDDEKGKFRLRQDKTLWMNGQQLVFLDGEVRQSKPEYRGQNNATQDDLAKKIHHHFEFRQCKENKYCLAATNQETSTSWEVVTEKWRVIDPIIKQYAESDAKFEKEQNGMESADKLFLLKQVRPDGNGTCAHLFQKKVSDKQDWEHFDYCRNQKFVQFTMKDDKTLWTQDKQLVYFKDELVLREPNQAVNEKNDPKISSLEVPMAQFTFRPCFTDTLPQNTTCLSTEGEEWRLWPWQPVFVNSTSS